MANGKLPKKVLKEVQDYIQILKTDRLPITSVYVFGSYARGKQRKDSDIDVCVISPKFKNSWNALVYLRRKAPSHLGWIIEPLGFSPKDFRDRYSSLIAEIKRHGIKV